MEKNALTNPAISARGGLFLIGWAGAVGFSIGLIIGTRAIRRDLRELEELHADTRTRVFALDTVDEAKGIVREGIDLLTSRERIPRVRLDVAHCKECGDPEDSYRHVLDRNYVGAHPFVDVDDQIFPHAAGGDKSPSTETP